MDAKEMIVELRKSLAKLETARNEGDAAAVSHALDNFLACAEIVSRRLKLPDECNPAKHGRVELYNLGGLGF